MMNRLLEEPSRDLGLRVFAMLAARAARGCSIARGVTPS